MTQDALQLIVTRNAFYRRMHYLALLTLVFLWAVVIALALTLYFLIKNPTKPVYFSTDKLGRLISVSPLNVPNMKLDEVMNWTVDAVQHAYTFDYINFRKQLQSAQRYFTTYGWRQYMRALVASRNVEGVRERKYIGIAQVVDKPKLLQSGLLGNSYGWRFEMPVLVSYLVPPNYDEQTKFSNALIVTVLVKRQQESEGLDGLGIVQLIATSPVRGIARPASISNTGVR